MFNVGSITSSTLNKVVDKHSQLWDNSFQGRTALAGYNVSVGIDGDAHNEAFVPAANHLNPVE